MKKNPAIPFHLFCALWVVTLLAPFGAFAISPFAGIGLGIALPVLWIARMPVGCMGGAFIASPFAMLEIASGVGWLASGIRLWTK